MLSRLALLDSLALFLAIAVAYTPHYSISPGLLEDLAKSTQTLTRKLDPSKVQKVPAKFVPDAKAFHWCVPSYAPVVSFPCL